MAEPFTFRVAVTARGHADWEAGVAPEVNWLGRSMVEAGAPRWGLTLADIQAAGLAEAA